ncbi:restriction endonuclease subunit S [Aeromonas dhakensis]|uniref:restriction endonuclease subunit S n=1 Tax=Aeromonas dhakensis TaxID=196024 RepID=UPI003F74A27B
MAIENLITDHLDLWTAAVRPKSSVGRGSNSKLELTGIKKLRELILELAVRGKLVPQDPSDEPASVLLERIAAEKAQLVKEGKIKKSKALPKICEDKKPFDLPVGWEVCRLGEISKQVTDGVHHTPKYLDTGVPFISVKDIDGKAINFSECKFISEEQHREINQRCNPERGDILICRIGTLGRVTIVDTDKPFSIFVSVGLIKFFQDLYIQQFSHLVLSSPLLTRQYDEIKAGGSHTSKLNLGDIPKLILPVCSVAEQHRIVAKVDELMALCDQLEQRSESQLAAHQTLVEALLATLTDSTDADEVAQNWARLSTHFDTLFTTEASIEALKQTILQLAVMGKLVPQDPSDEPASALLERIAAEKAQLVKEKKIKKEKPLPAISEDEKPFELPQGWEWCHLKDIITIMDAGWSPACPPESSPDIDTWGVLKTTAVQTLEYREYENKVLDKTKTPRPEYEVMVGDILITRAGPKNRVGISCLVEKTRPKLMISDKIIRFHLVEVGLSERFISLCLNAGATAVYIDDSKSGMAESQMNISQDKLKLAPIPLGPIKEQNHIMDRVDQLMTLCDQLKVCLQTSQQTQLALAESLVEGALA